MKCLRAIPFLGFLLFGPLLPSHGIAQTVSDSEAVDPAIQWKVVHSKHFDLVYDAKQREEAQEYFGILEDVYATLSQVFEARPGKTLVVLEDRTDLSNGAAMSFPEDLILAYPVLPSPLDSIYEHGAWPEELIMHEYTHILSFQPTRGVAAFLKRIFGSVITPNMLLPRWFLEGIAVEMETRFSKHGRLRSEDQEGDLRAIELGRTMEKLTLSEINETATPTWPGGSRPYLFGSLMWSYMISKKGVPFVDQLHKRYGGRVPYFLDGAIEDEYGETFEDIFEHTKIDASTRLQKQLAELKTLEPSRSSVFASKYMQSYSPNISPDGLKMAYMAVDEGLRRTIHILKRPNLQTRFEESQEIGEAGQWLNDQLNSTINIPVDNPPGGTINRISWLPDSSGFVFDRVSPYLFTAFSDLWFFDLKKSKAGPLSWNLRAREPAISPDGARVAFVGLGASRTNLSVMDMGDKKVRVLYQPPLLETISFPLFVSPHDVAFTIRHRDGSEEVWTLDIDAVPAGQMATVGPFKKILLGVQEPEFLTKTPEGITFVGHQNRVANLYFSAPPYRTAVPLTHSLTGIQLSAFDAQMKEIYVTEMNANGRQIRIVPQSEWRRLSGMTLPQATPLFQDRYPEGPNVPEPAKSLGPNLADFEHADDYSVWPHLWPKYWLPFSDFVLSGGVSSLSALTSGSDPLGKDFYGVNLSYYFPLPHLDYNAFLIDQHFKATLIAVALESRYDIPYTSLDTTSKWQAFESQWGLNDLMGIFGDDVKLPSRWALDTAAYTKLLLGWQSRGGEIERTSGSYSSGPSLGVQYSTIRQAGYQISPEGGTLFRASYTNFLDNGGWAPFQEYRLSLQHFFSKWLPDHHVIKFRFEGRWVDRQLYKDNFISSNAVDPNSNALTSFLYSLDEQIFPDIIMRGYLPAAFLGKSVQNINVEYRFPLRRVYHGSGTSPFFLRQIYGAVVFDGLTQSGLATSENPAVGVSPLTTTKEKQFFYDYGAELKSDWTGLFEAPFTAFIGAYITPPNPYNTQKSQVVLNLGYFILLY